MMVAVDAEKGGVRMVLSLEPATPPMSLFHCRSRSIDPPCL